MIQPFTNKIECKFLDVPLIKVQEDAKQKQKQAILAHYKILEDPARCMSYINVMTKTGDQLEYRRCLPTEKKPIAYQIVQPKQKKQITKKRKPSVDQQFSIKIQKKDRNVTSNLIHHLIKYLLTTQGNQPVTKKILEHNKSLKITYNQFLEQLYKLKKSLRIYITTKDIDNLWFSEQGEEMKSGDFNAQERERKKDFSYIMRVLSRKFFSENGFLSVYFSNKFNHTSKLVHFRGVRNLVWVLMRKLAKEDIDL